MIVGGATNVCVVTTACSVKTVAFLYLDIPEFGEGLDWIRWI